VTSKLSWRQHGMWALRFSLWVAAAIALRSGWQGRGPAVGERTEARGSGLAGAAPEKAFECPQRASCICFTPDGQTLAAGREDGTVTVWSVTTDLELLSIRAHARGVTAIAFSPDGKEIASSGDDMKAKFWDARTGKTTRADLTLEGVAFVLEYGGDGFLVIAGCGIGSRPLPPFAELRDLTANKSQLWRLNERATDCPVALTPDGQTLAIARGTLPSSLDALRNANTKNQSDVGHPRRAIL
jgi:WD40 repeat protein